MRRLLPDQVTPERLAKETPDQRRSVQITSGGQKFGQKFSSGERTLAQPTVALFGDVRVDAEEPAMSEILRYVLSMFAHASHALMMALLPGLVGVR